MPQHPRQATQSTWVTRDCANPDVKESRSLGATESLAICLA